MTEEWRGVEGFPDYEVSNLGRVRSKRLNNRWNPQGEWRILATRFIGSSKNAPLLGRYHGCALYNEHGRKDRFVHHLVLEAFVGRRPGGMQACHNDDNPNNNRLENLRWDTPTANNHDRDMSQRHVDHERYANGGCRTCRLERYRVAKA